MRRSLAITVAVIGLIWLASLAVMLMYVADLTDVPALVGAIVVQIGVSATLAALLIQTNTRRPRGVDPDVNADDATIAAMGRGVMLDDGRPYGRRRNDDRNVVERLSSILEEEAAKRPGPAKTPDWAINLRESGQVEIADERQADES